jgi:peptidoglycan-associated lipoprotein
MIKRLFMAVAVALAVVGCSSVKLDDVPVEDKSATAVTAVPPAAGSAPGATTQSSVAPVAADPAGATVAGPANVARIIYFDYDSYVVKPQFQSVIDGHAQFLKANPARRVSIEGHTDERGGREYNLALGQRRSEAVRRALGLLGVPDAQVEAVSFGKEKPQATGSDEAAWAQNRRAEIVYR